MILELCGLPGSGKSTLAQKCAAHYKLPIITVGRFEKYFLAFLFFLTYPKYSLHVLGIIHANPEKRLHRLLIGTCLINRGARYIKAQKNGLLDEGLSQNFFSLYDRVATQKEIDTYVSLLPHIDMVVECSTPHAQARDAARQLPRRSELGESYRIQWWEAMNANSTAYIDALKAKGITVQYPAQS